MRGFDILKIDGLGEGIGLKVFCDQGSGFRAQGVLFMGSGSFDQG